MDERSPADEDAPPTGAAGIVFRAAVYDGSGYADGNLEILAGLERARLPVQLVPVGLQEDASRLLPPPRRDALQQLQRHRFDLSHSVLYQCVPPPDLEVRLPARIRIGRTTGETATLPKGWIAPCNGMDQVWVPSTFNREAFVRSGVDAARLRVMPEGVDTRRYRPGLKPLPLPARLRRGFTFLSVFDWIDRKGPDILLRAFVRAFEPDDEVVLLLKIHKFDDPTANLESRLLYFLEHDCGVRYEQAPPIAVLSGLLPADAMPRLYNSADAFVLPSRGEGWGRPYMEAAACGLPVIATRWSGHMDFLNDGNSFLISPEAIVPAPRESDREIYIGHEWAEPSVDHLTQLLRQVAGDRAQARARGKQARRDMVERWDSRVLAPRWTNAFRELLD